MREAPGPLGGQHLQAGIRQSTATFVVARHAVTLSATTTSVLVSDQYHYT